MKVLLIKNNRLYTYSLPKKVKDNFWITDIDTFDNERNLINIEARNGVWYLTSNYETSIVTPDKTYDAVPLVEYNFYTLKNENENYYYYLYTYADIDNTYMSYEIIGNGDLIIGSSDTNNIIYRYLLVDSVHAKLTYENGNWKVFDNNSKFGIYVNDKKIINGHNLKYGDIIFISGLKIIVMNNFLLINNISNNVSVNSSLLRLKEKVVYNYDETISKEEELDRNLYSKEEYFYRSPRFVEDIIKETVAIEDPPAKVPVNDTSLIMTIGPMFTMAITSFTSVFSVVNNIKNGETTWKKSMPTLLVAGAMFASMLIWPLITRAVDNHKKKKKEKERIEKYTKYLSNKEQEINMIINRQTQTLKDKYITLDECQNIIFRRKSNLWERSINQNDFLTLRLGIGNLPLYADIKYSEERFTMEEDELKKKIYGIVSKNKDLVNVPITISLIQKYVTSIVGDSNLASEFFKGLLLQMITFHSYEFLKIVILTNNENSYRWKYLHNLPYLFDDMKQIRFYAENLDETKELSLYLEKVFQDRKGVDSSKCTYKDMPPYYLIVTDNYHMYRDVEIINDILNQDTSLGFSLIILSEKIQNLPSECQSFINVNQNVSGFFESEISAGNQKEFKTEFCNNIDLNACINKIANIPIEINDEEQQLPGSISFLQMYNVGKVEQLNILNRWQSNNSQKSLSVPVGIEKSGSVLKLDLHEKYHGPHGLIAGMTGSGKSEFIITYILSLAVNFSPLDVAFILIDYKGGGLAGAFENRETGVSLPHLAGTITNLDVSEMNRSLASIESELRRRQKIFNEARDKLGESTVDIYKYQRFFKEGKVTEAIPHLFIISDEFAELKSQQPEFMDKLISAARIGRSLGIHLILATQKPSGVVNDQIWSNSRFRVCLKVQEKSDSNEMIKCPDAALIKQVGRFYLQVGYNELFALGQSAWCGAQYFPTDKLKKKIDQDVLVVDNIGNVISVSDDNRDIEIPSEGEELGNILSYIIKLSEDNNLKTKKLWLEKIADVIYIDNLKKKYNYQVEPFILNPIIGEYDDPSNQSQYLLTLNLTSDGNTCIYGCSGSGKELLISSMLYSLCSFHTPNEVNIYILEFGSGTLSSYRNAPHVGDVVLIGEDEKVNNLFKMIEREIEKRKKLFINYNGDYSTYCKFSGNTLPHILLIINNYDAFQEAYDFDDRMNQITRECAKFGIIVIATVNTTSGMRYKLRQNFKSDIALQFNDEDDYSAVIGNTHKLYPSSIYGRGLVKKDNIYEFQTAYAFNSDEQTEKLLNFVNELNTKYSVKASKIPVVPEKVFVNDLVNEEYDMHCVPIGISKEEITNECFDFKSNYITLVTANEIEQTNKFSKALIKLVSKVNNNIVVIFDCDDNLNSNYSENVSLIKDNYEEYLKKIISNMHEVYDLYTKNGYNKKSLVNYKNITLIINNFNKFILKLTDETKKEFFDYLEKVKDTECFDIILIDQFNNFKKIEYDKWYKSLVNSNNGIWIGNGIADQNILKTNIGFKRDNNEVPDGYGIIVRKMKTYLVNMVIEGDSNE